jgi:hypothetical protein
MVPTSHPTDGPHDPDISWSGPHDIGLRNRPPMHRAPVSRAYTLVGEFPSDGHPSHLSACETLAGSAEVAGGRTANRLVRFSGYRSLKV